MLYATGKTEFYVTGLDRLLLANLGGDHLAALDLDSAGMPQFHQRRTGE